MFVGASCSMWKEASAIMQLLGVSSSRLLTKVKVLLTSLHDRALHKTGNTCTVPAGWLWRPFSSGGTFKTVAFDLFCLRTPRYNFP
jgi:hypothetical protein